MNEEELRQLLVKLWIAGNDHAVCLMGEWIDEDHEGDECPEAPENKEIIVKITKYFEDIM